MTQARTLVTFLLDRSGSMEVVRDDTIGAFNAYLDDLKAGDSAEILFNLVQFDSQGLDKVCIRRPIAEVQRLDRNSYVPRDYTPLIDAAYTTIKAVETSLNGDAETKVVICVQTDGEENASKEHSWDELRALVKEKAALGWQFNFMGAGIDAYDQGARMGIAADQTLSYDHLDPVANKAAFMAAAENTRLYSRGAMESTSYSDAQKRAAGDKYAERAAGSGSKAASKAHTKKASSIKDDFRL
jgi:hypothetical protein